MTPAHPHPAPPSTAGTKERPILFSAPMVRAILAGQKTQTRRVMSCKRLELRTCEASNPPHLRYHEFDRRDGERYESGSGPFDLASAESQRFAATFCPYGRVGDRLWVKERWRPIPRHACSGGIDCDCDDLVIRYAADGAERYFGGGTYPCEWRWPKGANAGDVTPMFMPRWASRLTLEITGVRVQRLNALSQDDAIAEGIGAGFQMNAGWPDFRSIVNGVCTLTQDCPVASFRTLWESINGPGSWAVNPWVWAITFARLEAPHAVA